MCTSVHSFYFDLWSYKPSDPKARQRILKLITNKVSRRTAQCLTAPITAKEINRAIRLAPTGKVAGADGLVADLYKKLLLKRSKENQFRNTLLAAFQDVQKKDSLSKEFIRCYTANCTSMKVTQIKAPQICLDIGCYLS